METRKKSEGRYDTRMLEIFCKIKISDIILATSKEEIYKGGEIKAPKKIPDALGDFCYRNLQRSFRLFRGLTFYIS